MSEQNADTSSVDNPSERAPVPSNVTELATAREARRASKRKVPNRRVDRAKVERIKAELAAGTYKIDHMSVADKFIEHERNN